MDQQQLFYEDIYEALRAAIHALGGPKKVASALWPDKPLSTAAEHLANCLNRTRAEKLDPEQVLWILREARKVGCHVAIAYIAQDCGYAQPQPIEPEDEKAELQRKFVTAVGDLRMYLDRLARLGVKVA